MKKIMSFKTFMINERKKLNEGGGAGVDIKMDDAVTLTAEYVLTKDAIKVVKVESAMGETFKAEGYDDGMHDVGTWLLMLDDSGTRTIGRKSFDAIQLKFQDNSDHAAFMEDLYGRELTEDEINATEAKIKTIEDLFVEFPDAEIPVKFDLTFKDYREMHFGGWVRGDIGAGDIVLGGDGTKYDLGDSDSVEIGDNSYAMYWNWEDALSDLLDEIKPVINANEHFAGFWKKIFRNPEEDYREYVREELKHKIESDELDEEINDYISSVETDNMPSSLADMKKDVDLYVDGFLVWWMDKKYEYFWDGYLSQLKDEYSPSNKPE